MVALTMMGSGEGTFTDPTSRTNRKLANLFGSVGIETVRLLFELPSSVCQLGPMMGVPGSNVTPTSERRLNVTSKGVMLLVRMERFARSVAPANVKTPVPIEYWRSRLVEAGSA